MSADLEGEEMEIGGIGNYYGGLTLKIVTGGGYQWSIKNWDGEGWEAIPDYLGEALLKYAKE